MENVLNRPKMVIADIDGTIVDDNRIMSQRMKNTLIRMHNEGIILGIASGRPLDMNVFHKFTGWDLPFEFDMMIGMNGGQLYDLKTKELTDNSSLKPKYIKEIFEIMDKYGDAFVTYVYKNGEMHCTREDDMITDSATRNSMGYKIVSREEIASESQGKLMFRGEPKLIDEAVKYAQQFNCKHYHSFKTQPTMLEFQDPTADKGKTLVEYCDKYKIPVKDVWAFGDTSNDNGLLKVAGVGVCLKNGTQDTKECSDFITDYTNNEDGMAQFIEKKLFGIDELYCEKYGYKVTKINNNTFRISENVSVSEYLFVGDKFGLLYDTGLAAGNLRKLVEELLEGKPYVVVNSHGHDDHVAGNYMFDEVYISKEEEKMMLALFENKKQKEQFYKEMKMYAKVDTTDEDPGFFSSLEYKKAFEKATCNFKVHYVKNGDCFELGNNLLEVIKVKGHTPAGICLLDKKNRLLYVGDAILRHVSILHVGGQKVSDFIEGMSKLKNRKDEFDYVIAAHGHRQHGFRPLETNYIDKMLRAAKSIDVKKSFERKEVDGNGFEYFLDEKKYEDYDSVSIAYRLDCLD